MTTPAPTPTPAWRLPVALLIAALGAAAGMVGWWLPRPDPASYRAWLASTLAEEPLTILSGCSYAWLETYAEHPLPFLPLGSVSLAAPPARAPYHPLAATIFRRQLAIEPVPPFAPGRPPALRLRVTVDIPAEPAWPAVIAETLVFRGDDQP